ncbi:GIN domain-containing protein [Pedobacter immunditicola]|uniref:GIN domain-containing protein n=1 Tax=Pedobacter immunditicola TaxID=3133440 RepID=UPI0030A8746D
MKTSIKTVFAAALTAIFLSTTAFTTFATDTPKKATVKASAMKVNMVVVTGDVDVYLIHSDKEDIRVVPFGDNEANVSFKKRGAKLFISSPEAERATIYVYLKDLKRIDVSNTAMVKTQGDFNLEALQIFLKDRAKANVNVNTKSLYTVIKDESDLKLTGESAVHILEKAEYATLKTHKFNAGKTEAKTLKPGYAAMKKK